MIAPAYRGSHFFEVLIALVSTFHLSCFVFFIFILFLFFVAVVCNLLQFSPQSVSTFHFFVLFLLSFLDANDSESFLKYIDNFIDYVDSWVTKRSVVFCPNDEFREKFGQWNIEEPQDVLSAANIDLIFGNILQLYH